MKSLCMMVCMCLAWSALAVPRLAVNAEGIVFGEVVAGSNVVGTTELRNVGSAMVSVSRVKACCGAKAELSAMTIPPYGSVVLTVSFTAQNVGAFTKSIQISCNDPECPIIPVPVSGVVIASQRAENYKTTPCENIVRIVIVAFVCVGAAFLGRKGRGHLSARRCLEGVCRVGLGGLFAYAGAMKLCDASSFANLLSRYEMLPDILLSLFSVAIPLAECVAGSLLLFSRWARLSAAAISAMLFVFIIALSYAAVRGLDVSCGCFGGMSSEGMSIAIARDVFLLAISEWLMFCGKSRSYRN